MIFPYFLLTENNGILQYFYNISEPYGTNNSNFSAIPLRREMGKTNSTISKANRPIYLWKLLNSLNGWIFYR